MANKTIFTTIFTDSGKTTLVIQPTVLTLVSVKKITSGVVVMGQSQDMGPLQNAKGVQVTSTPQYFILNANVDSLYIYAESIEEVAVVASQIDIALIASVFAALSNPTPANIPPPVTKPVTVANPYDAFKKKR